MRSEKEVNELIENYKLWLLNPDCDHKRFCYYIKMLEWFKGKENGIRLVQHVEKD